MQPLRINHDASQEANGDNLGILFDLLDNNGMLSVLIRIAL